MPNSESNVNATLAKWIKSEEGQLYEQVGIRLQAMAKDPSIAGNFTPNVSYDGSIMGPLDDVRELGQKIFKGGIKRLTSLYAVQGLRMRRNVKA